MQTARRTGALVATVLVLAAAIVFCADPATLDEARTARRSGEPQRAVALLRAAMAGSPDVELQAELAMALLEAGEADDASSAAERAAREAPRHPAAARALALTASARHESARALGVLDAALAAHPSDGSLLAARGRTFWEIRRSKSAIEALQRAASDASSAAEAHYWLGRIYHFKGWQAEGAFPGWHDEPQYREQAQAAFKAASEKAPDWYAPYAGLGDTLLAGDDAGGALAAFDEALARGPNVAFARVGRWRALKALGRLDDARVEIVASSQSPDVRHLDAARRGFELLEEPAEAERVAAALLERFPASPAAASIEAARIVAAGRAKQQASVIERAPRFLDRFPASTERISVNDALVEATIATPTVPAEQLVQLIEARITARPDPAVYLAGGHALANRRARLDEAIRLAQGSVEAASTFIQENLGSYKMEGKIQNALSRSRAAGADLAGWAYFLKNDLASAAAKLEEADRLSRSGDMANQYHLAELARARGELDAARERYLTSLTLSGPAALRESARTALAAVHTTLGNDPAEFDAYLKAELDRRTAERRERLTQSLLDKQLPPIAITDLSGRPVELAGLRGRVVLLNFFSSWCGACRAELPHVKAAYEKYRGDESVAFLAVSLDDDPKRLERYLAEMKFPFPVARSTQKAAEEAFSVFDVPATFYLDRSMVVRYEARGGEIHGQAANRVQWFIDELKGE
jgi:thiol-disulfide isomerase/thioredoxin/Tfp pilus assembly protein PilF